MGKEEEEPVEKEQSEAGSKCDSEDGEVTLEEREESEMIRSLRAENMAQKEVIRQLKETIEAMREDMASLRESMQSMAAAMPQKITGQQQQQQQATPRPQLQQKRCLASEERGDTSASPPPVGQRGLKKAASTPAGRKSPAGKKS